jgi:hypothetical protein
MSQNPEYAAALESIGRHLQLHIGAQTVGRTVRVPTCVWLRMATATPDKSSQDEYLAYFTPNSREVLTAADQISPNGEADASPAGVQ